MSNYRILLLDYEPRSIAQTKLPLEAGGFEVEVVTDGLAGIEAFNRLHPDLVLIEAMLPKKHGFEVCQEIKRTPEGKRTPIVITTGVYRGRKYRSQALHIHGCDEYLEKPFASDLLISLCTRFLTGGKATVPTESAALDSASASEALSGIAEVVDQMAARTDPPHSYAASIVADLTEEEIIARLDALLPGDAAPCQAAPEETAEAHDVPEEPAPVEAGPLDPAFSPVEDLLEPLPEADEPSFSAPDALLDGAGLPDVVLEAGVEAAAPSDAAWTGEMERQDAGAPGSEIPGEGGAWPASPVGFEETPIEAAIDEKLEPVADEEPRSEDPQIVPFDSRRSRKRRRERSGVSPAQGSSAAAAEAVAATEPARRVFVEREIVPLPAAAAAAPDVQLEPPVRVARPAATPAPATAARRFSWWMVAAVAIVAAVAYYLAFKPATGENALSPFVESSSGPAAAQVETAAPAPVEPSAEPSPAERGAGNEGERPTAGLRERIAEEAAPVARRPALEDAKPAVPPAPKPAPAERVERSASQAADSARKSPWPLEATKPETPTPGAQSAETASGAAAGAGQAAEAEIVPPSAPEPALPDIARPATDRGALVSIEDVDTPPVATSRTVPAYTSRARMLRQQGSVFLNLLVDENGKVVDVQVVREIPASDLNDAALRAARTWTYSPATKDGVPVKVWKQEKINFTL